MSQNQPPSKAPVKIILSPEMYEIVAERRADHNARLAASGLPPREDEFPFLSSDQVEAEAKQRAEQQAATEKKSSRAGRSAARATLKHRRATIPGFERHSRKCQLCRHPHIDAIEEAYINWYSGDLIRRYFQIDDLDIIYRHARAAGLDALRRQNVRIVVENFIEQSRMVKVTVASVLRSIRALSCLDDQGRWTDLPSTHIVVSGTGVPARGATSSTKTLPSSGNASPPEEETVPSSESPTSGTPGHCPPEAESNRVNTGN